MENCILRSKTCTGGIVLYFARFQINTIVETDLLVEEGSSKSEPAVDGHDEGDASRAETEDAPEDPQATEDEAVGECGLVELHVHEDKHAEHSHQVVGGETSQHECVAAVAWLGVTADKAGST